MALQGVARPRFYVNVLEFLSESGVLAYYQSLDADLSYTNHGYDMPNMFRTLPVIPNDASLWAVTMPINIYHEQSFLAFLGHQGDYLFGIMAGISEFTDTIQINADITPNDAASNYVSPDYGGFSIRSFDGTYGGYTGNFPYPGTAESVFEDIHIGATGERWWHFQYGSLDSPIGSAVLGTYYDMPTSPNLSLTLSREYGGTTEVTTKNDTTYTNTLWNKAPKWGDLGAWELFDKDGTYRSTYETDQTLSKSGRRVWNLTFSYMDDRDLWGVSQIAGEFSGFSGLPDPDILNAGYLESDVSSGSWGGYDLLWGFFELDVTLLKHDNFFSQVWHKTMGGTIPFIFQPDKDNSNPDQFAIARIRSNSLKATQTAFNVYDINLVIEEVW